MECPPKSQTRADARFRLARPFDAVTLDAAGTIIEPVPSIGHIYSEVARRHGVYVEPERLQAHFQDAWTRAMAPEAAPAPFDQPDDIQFAWWRELVIAAFAAAGVLDAFGPRFPKFYAELYERFAKPDVWHVFDDVPPFLSRLRDLGIPAGIVSNWDNRLKRLIASTPIAHEFAFVLTSAEARSMKPSREIFHEAASRFAVAPARILHIGDSPREDIEGAQTAGLQALLLDRKGKLLDRSIPTLTAIPLPTLDEQAL